MPSVLKYYFLLSNVIMRIFISAKTMSLLHRHLSVSGDIVKAFTQYLTAKTIDFKDFIVDENQAEGDGRFKSNSQKKWEDFAALVRYAQFLKFNAKKSAFDVLDELVAAKIKTIKKVARSKIQEVSDAASHVQHSVRAGLTTVRETLS